MEAPYLGKLDYRDPLYGILFDKVCPGLKSPVFHVNQMSRARVFKYTEESTGTAAIGKFFRMDDSRPERVVRIKSEYENLHTIRSYGFDAWPDYVVRPISRDERIGLALIEEFINGRSLDYYFQKGIGEGRSGLLKDVLSRLASFLYKLHAKTRSEEDVSIDAVAAYFRKILDKIEKQDVIEKNGRRQYLKLMDKWLGKKLLLRAKNSIVHGDATPTNFIFTGSGVVAIDLERMRNADPVLDVGMICGEIKHAFMWRTGDPYLAEPFISHFLRSYASSSPGKKGFFRAITFKNPFYMALTELRIARNSYLARQYRKRLAGEALMCLKYGLKLR